MDELRKTLQVLDGSVRQNAVAEVENVPRPTAGALNHPASAVLDHGPGPQQQGGIRVHQTFGREELARRLALDQVAGEREGRSREADHRDRRVELPAKDPDRLQYERYRLGSRLSPQPIYILPGPDRLLDYRTDPVHQLQVDPKAEGNRQHDVGEEDRPIDTKPPHRLHGDLRAQFRLLADREEVDSLTDLPVLGQGSPCVPHEPYRATIDHLAPRRPNERRQHRLGRPPAQLFPLNGSHPPASRLTGRASSRSSTDAGVPSPSASLSASSAAMRTQVKIGVSRSV